MTDHLKTLREALDYLRDTHVYTHKQAIAAIDALETAMREPVSCRHFTDEQICRAMNGSGFHLYGVSPGTPLYTAPPAQQPRQITRPKLTPEDIAAEDAAGGVFAAGALVAQQPRQCGLCGADEAFTGTCGGGRGNPSALCHESPTQQPQAEAVPSKPVGYVSALALRLFSGSATDHTIRLRHTPSGAEVIPIFTPAPEQAEAVPSDCDVRKIMLDVVPGEDGMGREVYAKNVSEVLALLTKMGQRIEDLEGAKQAKVVPPSRAEAAAEILQHRLGWTYHDGEWREDRAATETLRQRAEAVPYFDQARGEVILGPDPTPEPQQAEAVPSDAQRLDWIAIHGSFGVDSVTGLPGGNGQKHKAATRAAIDAAMAKGAKT